MVHLPRGGQLRGRVLGVADARPTWALVLEAATQLAERLGSPFTLSELIAEVQRRDPARGRGTISPVVQGMTANAGKGPESPCGKVFLRVGHGRYTLRDVAGETLPTLARRTHTADSRLPLRRARRLGQAEVRARLDGLIADFDHCVVVYDRSVPFTRSGQYELHRSTIERRRALGSAEAACRDDKFTELLHLTLQSWGIRRRA